MKIYLDNCCFNRPYDDLSSETIRLEAEAKLLIQNLILDKKLELVWSFVLSIENNENLDDIKKKDILQWKNISIAYINADEETEKLAENFVNIGIKAKDASHLACAVHAKVEFFITTDRKLIRKSESTMKSIQVVNPIDFIAIMEGKYEK